jgi:hypothetical protein
MVVLASEVWWASHRDGSGRPRLAAPALRLGLAAGLILELLAAGRIVVDSDRVVVWSSVPPSDPVSHEVLADLVDEAQVRTVGVWLDVLAASSVERVSRRLLRSGLVRAQRRALWGSRLVPTSPVRAGSGTAVLGYLLREGVSRGERLDDAQSALLGVMWATGLDRIVWAGAGSDTWARVDAVVRALPPGVGMVVAQTRAAVESSVLIPS